MNPTLSLAPPRPGVKLWLVLLALGLAGFVLASPYFLQVLSGLAAKVGKPVSLLFVVEGVKVVVITGLMGWLGIWASRRNGLEAPVIRAKLEGKPIGRALLELVPRGLLWGTVGALVVVVLNAAFASALPDAMRLHGVSLPPAERAVAVLVGASSAFYGGFVEELLLRWGVMSLLMVATLKVLPRTWAFVVANVLSAALFGAGHLPLALQLGAGGLAIVYVVGANMLVGLICGWLFFRRGLEQAIVAHAWADVALHAVPILFLA